MQLLELYFSIIFECVNKLLSRNLYPYQQPTGNRECKCFQVEISSVVEGAEYIAAVTGRVL